MRWRWLKLSIIQERFSIFFQFQFIFRAASARKQGSDLKEFKYQSNATY